MNNRYVARTLILAGVLGLMSSVPWCAQAQSSSQRIVVEGDSVTIAPPVGAKQFRVEIFSSGGRLIFDTGFVDGQPINWDRKNAQGQSVPEGVYILILTTTDEQGAARKVMEQMIIGRKSSDPPRKTEAAIPP